MPMKSTDRLLANPRGDAETAIALAWSRGAERIEEVKRYVHRVFAKAVEIGLDPCIVVAQAIHETGWFTSYWWKERLNPAGLGITGDAEENAASHTWADGTAAADSHLAHLLLYATGKIDKGGLTEENDPRYDAYVEKFGEVAVAQTIGDLTKKWGIDPEYGAKVVGRGNEVWPNLGGPTPNAVVFGRVPYPPIQNRDIPNSQNSAWNDLGPRTIRAVCWHRMLGSLWGTDGYFRNAEGGKRALTDYGVGVMDQDGAENDGLILRWNDPRGRRSPWANGAVSGAYGDGLAFVERYGVNAVNRDIASIEISGFQETPLTVASRNAVCAVTAYWADQYGVSWETFPLIPSEGNRSFVTWHQEFTIGTGKKCPFKTVMDETPAMIEKTKEILKKHQTAATTPPPPRPNTPKLPKGMSQGVAQRLFNPEEIAKPDGGRIGFNLSGEVSQWWLKESLATVPNGADWTEGDWSPLASVTKRGDGRLIYQFANGWIYEDETP